MSNPDSVDPVLVWLWELRDGTRAAVVEHPVAPHWELRVVRRDRVVERERCASWSDLISASLAARLRADSGDG